MPTLSDKLKSYGVKVGARDLPPPPPRHSHAIENVVGGMVRATPFGKAFVVETLYADDYRHGRAGLHVHAPLQTIADWAREQRLVEHSAQKFVYLDTETTGLEGGSGTYAFMIGVARYEGSTFHLAQFFMRDPDEEAALLHAVTEFIAPGAALVTFNGKGFDVPLLNARYIQNRFTSPLPQYAHLDLLPLARRLWRDRLESRALGSLERHILGARRSEDEVPGFLIPQLYFEYLRSGDARPLKGVFYHNAMDVLAMAALLNHISQMLDDPVGFAGEHGIDVIAIAKMFEDMGRWEDAVELYTRGMEQDLPEANFREALQRLSFLQRRRGNRDAAMDLWRQAARAKQLYAYVELAKTYEHERRDPHEAAKWTRAALDIIHADEFPRDARRVWLAELEHRLARLERKIETKRGK
ncbi:MAG TPA: ribonuclease H-like domain-containing protein [Anaerolineae bacterium]